MRIAVCEDNKLENDMLCELLREEAERFALDCEVISYESGDAFLDSPDLEKGVDFLILDIYMHGKNGILTAMKARELNPGVQIAFLTASRDFALDAFQLDALHYLVKPITAESVRKLLDRYQERMGKQKLTMLKIRTPQEELEFPMNRIEKLVSAEKKCDLYLEGIRTPVRIPLTFSDAEMQMQEDCFLKLSRGLLVHMDFIVHMTASECLLRDGKTALLSRNQREEIRDRYKEYCRRRLSNASKAGTAARESANIN